MTTIAGSHSYAGVLPDAGCGIIVCSDREKEGMTGFLVEDVLNLPENIAAGMVVEGIKDEERKSKDRYDESSVRFDKW